MTSARGRIALTLADAKAAIADLGLPVVLRPSFSIEPQAWLIDLPSNIEAAVAASLQASPIHEILISKPTQPAPPHREERGVSDYALREAAEDALLILDPNLETRAGQILRQALDQLPTLADATKAINELDHFLRSDRPGQYVKRSAKRAAVLAMIPTRP